MEQLPNLSPDDLSPDCKMVLIGKNLSPALLNIPPDNECFVVLGERAVLSIARRQGDLPWKSIRCVVVCRTLGKERVEPFLREVRSRVETAPIVRYVMAHKDLHVFLAPFLAVAKNGSVQSIPSESHDLSQTISVKHEGFKDRIVHKPRSTGRGSLINFVRENVDFSQKPAKEIDFLCDETRKGGIVTTRVSVSKCYYQVKHERAQNTVGRESVITSKEPIEIPPATTNDDSIEEISTLIAQGREAIESLGTVFTELEARVARFKSDKAKLGKFKQALGQLIKESS